MAIEITNGFTINQTLSRVIQNGLAFDFVATDYVSGSTIWTDRVNGYKAYITGSKTTLDISGSSVLFDGTQWLQFDNSITSSINTLSWQVYSYFGITAEQRIDTSYQPGLFSKGASFAPNWRYEYRGGGINAGQVYINGGYPPAYTGDGFNALFTGQNQLLVLSFAEGLTTTISASVTVNQYSNVVNSSTIISDNSYLYPTQFSGSTNEPILFGYGASDNLSGSVVRLMGYNRILSSKERVQTWNYLQANT